MVPVSEQTVRIRVLRKLGEDLFHRAVKVNFHRFAFTGLAQFLWNVLAWVVFQFLIQIPSRLIFALMLRSAEQETPMPTGQDAP